ncbi:MAG TPA: glycosyltransferase family 4 protein [Kofleriaceae bacterium]|nr:glycosyltransferase family 4 protein [Kofleriaceae bacterium]
MPRVLIAGFCTAPGPDRIGVQLSHIIRALARHHAVDVLVVRRGDQAYVERFASARLLRVPVPDGPIRSRIDAFRRALGRQLEGADYDIVHFRDGWSGVPVLEMRDRLKYAAVFDAGRSPLGEPPVYDLETASALERDELDCVQRADMVLAATEPARRYFASLVPEERVRLVPPGVDVDLFDWDAAPTGRPRILYAGALTPGRGVRVLLRAMLDVAAHSDARLALAGRASPEFFASLEAAVRDLGMNDRVQLLGEVPHEDVPALIGSAAVCVAPGAVDLGPKPLALYPTKLLEYMACQRPVVAPRRGSVTTLLRDEQHGLLFEPGHPVDLAQKILHLLDDPDLRFRIARGGYELVRRAHTASTTRRELRRAYAWLAGMSPWRERFAALLEEMPSRDLPVLAAIDPTGPGGWVLARPAQSGDRPIAAFDGDLLIEEVTESVQVDTGLNEGLGEVTRVEQSPLLGDDDSANSHYESMPPLTETSAEAAIDDWIVDDVRIRDPLLLERESHADERPSPVDARFVAGEVEVPSPGSAAGDPFDFLDSDRAFTALSQPLGLVAARAETNREETTETAPSPLYGEAEETEGREVVARPPRPIASPPPPAKVVVGPEAGLRVGTGEDTGP